MTVVVADEVAANDAAALQVPGTAAIAVGRGDNGVESEGARISCVLGAAKRIWREALARTKAIGG